MRQAGKVQPVEKQYPRRAKAGRGVRDVCALAAMQR